jgi:dTDP-4-amino-4,6-dideoxygalactose transaminase
MLMPQRQAQTSLREQILSLGEAFFAEHESGRRFVPGQTYIPPSGKVLNAEDLRSLLDASLDMWLTAGRYAGEFERALATFRSVEYRVVGELTNTDKLMEDAFSIGVWPGIEEAERNYIVSTFVDMVRHLAR